MAEKPSVARDIARVVGATRKGPARLEGPDVWVAWCLGHLVEPAMPDVHDPRWKSWDPGLLPMLPRQLVLQPNKRTAKHFRTLKKTLRDPQVAEVINACDAGREGELIFRYVYELAGCKAPVQRFWVSSLTPSAIRAGLSALQPAARFDGLGAAARCRAEADWLVGMNGTRALTAVGGTLLSVGRVQTPTLALIVDRDETIEGFVPEPYWEVHADLQAPNDGGEPFEWRARWTGAVGTPRRTGKDAPPMGRLDSAEAAAALAATLEGQRGQVVRADRQRQKVPPPQLHHLTSLQQEANRRFGLTAEQTLKTAQSLYERHKLLTYPRTDSRHLTADVGAQLPRVLKALNFDPYSTWVAPLLAQVPKLNRRFVDDSKVGDHHAIIPTDRAPNLGALNQNERRIYDLVARRLVAAHLPDAVYAKTRLETHVAQQRLEASGRVRLEPGWEVADPPAAARNSKAKEAELPAVMQGAPAQVLATKVAQKETRPPKRFTEATVLGAMERAGRSLEEAELRDAMRAGGLGTPATRASILETLLRRGYVGRQGKMLISQPPGRALVAALPVDDLKSPRLTGAWEARLQAIADGRAQAMPFRRDIRQFTRDLVAILAKAPRIQVPEAQTRGRRGAGGRGRRGAGAQERRSRAKGSGSRQRSSAEANPWRSSATDSAPRSDLAAAAAAAAARALGSAAPPPAKKAAPQKTRTKKDGVPKGPPKCPKCREGQVVAGRRAWGCSRWQAGCRFVISFVVDGIRIPDDEADRLVRRRQTRLFATRPGAKKWRLVLDLDAADNVRWAPSKR